MRGEAAERLDQAAPRLGGEGLRVDPAHQPDRGADLVEVGVAFRATNEVLLDAGVLLRLGHYRRADELLDAILMAKDVNG